MNGQAGKGDGRRPCLVSQQELNLRWKLAYGKITFEDYAKRMKEIKDGKEKR